MPQPPAHSDSDRCKRCEGKCCSYFCLQIDTPRDYDEFEDVRWYLCHKDVSIHVDDQGDWYMQIINRCQFLDENYGCAIYHDRPLLCRKYSDDTCEDTDHGYGYLHEFQTQDELEAHMVKTFGREEYERQMIKWRSEHEHVTTQDMTQRLDELGKLKILGRHRANTTN